MYIIYIYSIDIECREPHGRMLTPNTQRMQVCILTAQGCTNRTLAVHDRVNSRFLVLPGSLSIFNPDYCAQIFKPTMTSL